MILATESDKYSSCCPPAPEKRHRGIFINEPSEPPRIQEANPPTPTRGGKKLRKHIAMEHVNVHSKLVSPPQNQTLPCRVPYHRSKGLK